MNVDDREWLVTNGLGGYASGPVIGAPTRKYHGLLVPNLVEPNGRHVVISSLDEEILVDGEPVDCELKSFQLEGSIPSWTLRAGPLTFTRQILVPHGRNVVCVRYRISDIAAGSRRLVLKLLPYIAFRLHEQPPDNLARTRARFHATTEGGAPLVEVSLAQSSLAVRMRMLQADATFLIDERDLPRHYPLELDRGYHATGCDYGPGAFVLHPAPRAEFCFIASTDPLDFRAFDVPAQFEAERQRTDELLRQAGSPTDPLISRLVLAADQFIVQPANRSEEAKLAESAGRVTRTVIAGYHWFGDWGRDTMISLEGLTLCTGRHAEAAAILRTFVGYVKDGLVPNLFPEGARAALYHTVDATLWMFHAIDRYTCWTRDWTLVAQVMPVLESICRHYIDGTHYGIGVDAADGLVKAGAPGYQLTWMDAKAGDWIVTPRRGKPVEIQGLWFNALSLMAEWRSHLGLSATEYVERAVQCRASFNARYWIDDQHYLYDVVDGEHGDDASGRPNQLLAFSLHHPVLDSSRWSAVTDYVRRELLTPYGLRTLSPSHPDYRRNYHGDLITRDGAYHQGTVWPWLIGPYLDAERALAKLQGRAADTTLLRSFESHLAQFGVGSIAEIFDAEPPYQPRGCIAQAWSVAEVLRTRMIEFAEAGGEGALRPLTRG